MNMLDAAGPQALHIQQLWNVTLVICCIVFAGVLAALIWALWRRPRSDAASAPDLATRDRPERGAQRSVGTAVTASVLGLLFLIVASFMTDRALARLSLKDALHIEVTANQWWWDFRYDDAQAGRVFNTANELHVPVGRPVILTLKSNDVIHSLWVPRLHGKKDLIPGRTATLHLQADREGSYRGQCAEFCGFQHAFMAFRVIAEPPAQYEAWADRQRSVAPEPTGSAQQRGRELFLSSTCVMCHAISGTIASARRGPDLTHVASRATLAAGTLPNTDDAMARWIRNPQQFKPGVNMPASNLPDDELAAIVAYLRSLS
jgi:cytochrome c oxidase subunit II